MSDSFFFTLTHQNRYYSHYVVLPANQNPWLMS